MSTKFAHAVQAGDTFVSDAFNAQGRRLDYRALERAYVAKGVAMIVAVPCPYREPGRGVASAVYRFDAAEVLTIVDYGTPVSGWGPDSVARNLTFAR